MLIRALTTDDIPAWLAIAHESDEIVSGLIPDITTFYKGFDDYVTAKIKQHEAFMVEDRMSGNCLGVIAFSKSHNRITFLGVTKDADFQTVGGKLMEIALNQLDNTKEITANVLKSDAEPIKQERALYERFSFVESIEKIEENGAPAIQMKRPPLKTKQGYSFHYDYPGYLEWMDKKKCPLCNHEPVWSDHDLIAELKYATIHASMKAQGLLWGKCVLLCKKHITELYELSPGESSGFMTDIQKTTK